VSGKVGWFVMEITSPITFFATILPPVYQMLTNSAPTWTTTQTVLSILWFTHYINRSIVYPLRAHSMSNMNVITVMASVLFNGANAYTNGMWVAKYGSYPDSILQKPHFWLGVGLWAIGWLSNIHHDNILFKLRRDRQVKDNKKRYLIPHGGLYEYISCPNYFCETVEWCGWAIASYPSPPANVFVLGSIANLFPRAWKAHQWYKKEFPEYPSSRKAVVPFVF
jgi:3-oxo-5-alpha-steroid 4-dehydrogenase 1